MADAARARKLAVRIREIVAAALRSQIKDPRLGMITITDTKITADLRDATVFYTVLGDETDKAGTAAALESARGMLRAAVGRQTGVKFTPTLAFHLDEVPDTARAIDDLLAKAREADEELQRRAAGAQYAGEPDPYRAPPADDEDDGAENPPASGTAARDAAVNPPASGTAARDAAVNGQREAT
jgi:ribosome-binding factor A